MRSRLIPGLAALMVVALAAGCSSPRLGSSNMSPVAASPPSAVDTFVGNWSTTGSSTSHTPRACTDMVYDVSRGMDGASASVQFKATCAGITVAGNGAGFAAGSTLTWSVAGTVSRDTAQLCSFDFKDNTATRETATTLRVTYAGTVCGFPVSGSHLLQRCH